MPARELVSVLELYSFYYDRGDLQKCSRSGGFLFLQYLAANRSRSRSCEPSRIWDEANKLQIDLTSFQLF